MPTNSKRKLLSLSERFSAIKTPVTGLDVIIHQPETPVPELAGSPNNINTSSPHMVEDETTVATYRNKNVKRNLKVSLTVNQQIRNGTKCSRHTDGLSRQSIEISPNVLSSEQKCCSLQGTKSSTAAAALKSSGNLTSQTSHIYEPNKSVSEIYDLHGIKTECGIFYDFVLDEKETPTNNIDSSTCNPPTITIISTNVSDTSNSITDVKIPNVENNHQELHSPVHKVICNASDKVLLGQAENLKSCHSRHFTKFARPLLDVADKSAFLIESDKNSSHLSTFDDKTKNDQIHEKGMKCLELDMPNVQTNDYKSCSSRFDENLVKFNASCIGGAKSGSELSSGDQIVEVPSSYNSKTSTVFCDTKVDTETVCLENVSCVSQSVCSAIGHCDVSFQENHKYWIQPSVKTSDRKRRHSENQTHNPSCLPPQPYSASKIVSRATSGTPSKPRHTKTYRDLFNTEYGHMSNLACHQNLEFWGSLDPNQTKQLTCDVPSCKLFCVGNSSSSTMTYSKPSGSEELCNPGTTFLGKSTVPRQDIHTVKNVPQSLPNVASPALTLSQHCNIQTASQDIDIHSTSDTCNIESPKICKQNVPQFENRKVNPPVPNPYLTRFYKSNLEFGASQVKTLNALSHIGILISNPTVADEKLKTFVTESAINKTGLQSDDVDQKSALLVTTLLEQCKSLVQTDKDKEALNAVVTKIKHEADPDRLEVVDMECSNESSSEAEDEKNASVSGHQLPSVLHASKKTATNTYHIKNLKFEGRTLLKGGVEPRHVPQHLKQKPGKLDPVDPRTKSYDLFKYSVELPLPIWADEVIGAENVKAIECGYYKWNVNKRDGSVEKRATENQKGKNMVKMSNSLLQNKCNTAKRDEAEIKNKCSPSGVSSEKHCAKQLIETSNIGDIKHGDMTTNGLMEFVDCNKTGLNLGDQQTATVLKFDLSNMLGENHNQISELVNGDLHQTPKISKVPEIVFEENGQQTQAVLVITPEQYPVKDGCPDLVIMDSSPELVLKEDYHRPLTNMGSTLHNDNYHQAPVRVTKSAEMMLGVDHMQPPTDPKRIDIDHHQIKSDDCISVGKKMHLEDGELFQNDADNVDFYNEFLTTELCDKTANVIPNFEANFESVTVEESVTALLKHVRNSLKEKQTENNRSINNIEGKENKLETSSEASSIPLDSAEQGGNVSSESSDQIERTISNTEVPVITCFYEQPLVQSADTQSPKYTVHTSSNDHCGKENKNICLKMSAKPEKTSKTDCQKLKSAETSKLKERVFSPRKYGRDWILEVNMSKWTSDSRSKEHTQANKECSRDAPVLIDEHVISDSDRVQDSCRIIPDQPLSNHHVKSRKLRNYSQHAPRHRPRDRPTYRDRFHGRLAIYDGYREKHSLFDRSRESRTQRDRLRDQCTQHNRSPERCMQHDRLKYRHIHWDRSRRRSTRPDISLEKLVQQDSSRGRPTQYDKSLERHMQRDRSWGKINTQHNRSRRTLADRSRSSESNINRHGDIPPGNKSERNRTCLLFENGVLVTDDHSNELSFDNCVPSVIDTQDPINNQQDLSVTRSDFVEDNCNRRLSNEFSDYHDIGVSDNRSMRTECDSRRSENLDFFENKFLSNLERVESMKNVLPCNISDELSNRHSVYSEKLTKWSGKEIAHSNQIDFLQNSGSDMEFDNLIHVTAGRHYKENVFDEV